MVWEIAQHIVEESDFNLVNMRLLNQFSDNICLLGNLVNASSELPETAMMDLERASWQLKRLEATIMILWTNAQKAVFQYRERNANASKHSCNDEKPITNAPIMQLEKNPTTDIKTVDE